LWPANSYIHSRQDFKFICNKQAEPTVQESGNDARPSSSTPGLSSPRSLEEIQLVPKAQPKAVNNK
jgi:hypothetical protein